MKNTSNIYYPSISNSNFYSLINSRKEFINVNRNTLNGQFDIQDHQEFARNFINSKTPYDKLLMFWRTGAGKTCAAIQIAEEYRNSVMNPHIYIISSSIARINFEKELLSSCGSFANQSSKLIFNNVDQLVAAGYIFQNYQSFVNNRNGILTDSLVIIDEAHSLLNENTYALALQRLMLSSRRFKLVLMSATPMFNEPIDIVEFINLFYPSDRLDKYEIFTIDDKLKPMAKKIIESRLGGIVSYVAGNDPKYFPKKIDIGNIPPATLEGPEMEKIIQTKLIRVPMSPIQYDIYKKYWHGAVTMTLKKISDFAFPNGKFNKLEMVLKKIDDNYKTKYGIIYTNNSGIKSPISGPALNIKNLKKYSGKYYQCLSDMFSHYRPHGFIFSKFVNNSGIKLFANILEENGISPYSYNRNIPKNNSIDYKKHIRFDNWKNKKRKFISAKYVILHKDITLEERKSIIKIFNSDENRDGRLIKYILGSLLIKESLDLKRIKDIYILNVQENFSRVAQIIGRGIRYKSHFDIDDKNVRVYKYVSSIPDNNKASTTIMSSEELEYARDEYNLIIIKKIETMLKNIAIDCRFNKHINRFEKITCPKFNNENIDNLTYQLYYQEKEIFSIKRNIIELIGNNIIMNYSYIIQMINKENYFIDAALKQMLMYRHNFNNKHGVTGYLIELNEGLFAFNPIGLESDKININRRLYYKSPQIHEDVTEIIDNLIYRREKTKIIDIKNILKGVRNLKNNTIGISQYLSKLNIKFQINVLEWSIRQYWMAYKNEKILDPVVYNILRTYKNYLIDEKMIEKGLNNSNYDTYFDLESFNSVDRNKIFIGHYFDKPKLYDRILDKFLDLDKGKYLIKRRNKQIKKDNDFIIGYMDKLIDGRILFKLRFTKQIVGKDARKLKKGFICNQINNKQTLLKIAKRLEISTSSNDTIGKICNLIETDVRNKEILSTKYKTGIKWFYPYKFN